MQPQQLNTTTIRHDNAKGFQGSRRQSHGCTDAVPSGRETIIGDLRMPGNLHLVCSLLAEGYQVRLEVSGQSMRPFLQSGAKVILALAVPSRLRPGDLVLFLDRFNLPVLHRLLRKQPVGNGYLFHVRGDSATCWDEPFNQDRIIGKAVGVERQGHSKGIDLESPLWKARLRLRAWTENLRHLAFVLFMPVRRLLRSLLRPFLHRTPISAERITPPSSPATNKLRK